MVDQATIDRVASAIDGADIGFSMTLTELVDGVHTFRLEIDGLVEDFVDNDEEDASEQARARLRSIKLRKQAEAVIDALTPSPQPQEESDAEFERRYGEATDFEALARVLSGRLRQMDKRAKAANSRADRLEQQVRSFAPRETNLVRGPMPSYGWCSANDMLAAVAEARMGIADPSLLNGDIDPDRPIGHQIVPGINFNSLNRIISAFQTPSPVSRERGSMPSTPSPEGGR